MATEERKFSVEQWDVFETEFVGPSKGNPFREVTLTAEFIHEERLLEVSGFYDGDGTYRLRFMPDTPGEWSYITHSNRPILDAVVGYFTCTPASPGNHGPVRIADTHHFAYADGTPFRPFGTTCHTWTQQADGLEQQTLTTLAQSPFNKLRMSVLPRFDEYNRQEPTRYPFMPKAPGKLDLTCFNPAYFQHLEQRICDLRDLGIEADLILFHPYDNGRWGFDSMSRTADEYYLRYLIARLSSFRNVWWSVAQDHDLIRSKRVEDWDRFFQIIQVSDLHHHLCSILNAQAHYDYNKSWISHASIKTDTNRPDLINVADWRGQYGKPVIIDETRYEGNLPLAWGNLSAQEMVHRFWLVTVLGAYVTHGETYVDPDNILWSTKGGVLRGESPQRIAFLKRILDEGPSGGLQATSALTTDLFVASSGQDHAYFLAYTGRGQPAEARLKLPGGHEYSVDIIDPWAMTVSPVDGRFQDECGIQLPGIPYMALRLQQQA